MRRTRDPRRSDRLGCRPGLEGLETRTLLSITTSGTAPFPASIAPLHVQNPVPATSAVAAFDRLIGATATRLAYGVTGAGLTAAVIDTGVGYGHEALGDGFGPGHKVVAGYDFGDGDTNPDASTWSHGTAVAGLIASSDPDHPGVAPGADIAALRVFDSQNKGTYEKIADALQWVIDNHETLSISVVNLSVADGGNYIWDFFGQDGGIGQRIAGLIDELKGLRIPVVSAAGNSFEGDQGMGFTAILSETISVTATDAADHLLGDAQRLGATLGHERATDLAAPGTGLVAPTDGDGYSNVQGTSFAAPLISGSIILLQSIYQQRYGQLPTVDQVERWLDAGARTVHDPATGISLGRLDVARAAAQIPVPAGQTTTPPPDTSTPAPGPGEGPSEVPADSGSPARDDGQDGSVTPSDPPTTPANPDHPGEDSGSDGSSGGPTEQPDPVPPSTPAIPPVTPTPPPVGPHDSSGSPADPPTTPDPPTDPPSDSSSGSGTDEIDAALAHLYRNGRSLGMVRLGGSDDPSLEALDAFGIRGTVQTIRLWSAIGRGDDAHPTGSVVALEEIRPATPFRAQEAGKVEPTVLEQQAARREAIQATREARAAEADLKRSARGLRRLAAFAHRLGGW